MFFTTGAPVKIKLEGKIQSLGGSMITPELAVAAANGIMNEAQRREFAETMESDFAIGMPDGSARFRVNVFRQRGHVGMVLRLIPSGIPIIEELNVPEVLKDLIGTVVGHILTIEDPVEFYHPNLMSIINQREVGVDTTSYARALKASLREAPDVI